MVGLLNPRAIKYYLLPKEGDYNNRKTIKEKPRLHIIAATMSWRYKLHWFALFESYIADTGDAFLFPGILVAQTGLKWFNTRLKPSDFYCYTICLIVVNMSGWRESPCVVPASFMGDNELALKPTSRVLNLLYVFVFVLIVFYSLFSLTAVAVSGCFAPRQWKNSWRIH